MTKKREGGKNTDNLYSSTSIFLYTSEILLHLYTTAIHHFKHNGKLCFVRGSYSNACVNSNNHLLNAFNTASSH